MATIPDVIVQPLATNNVAAELPVETAVINITNAQQTLAFALNKVTEKTYVSAAQKAQAVTMPQQNRDVFSLPGDKPTITSELTISI
uniref:Uncharacterized protein n=1 Tax=Romanomermis culicivorax TaxID=13658 RepID=A0A915JEG0_ROMCU